MNAIGGYFGLELNYDNNNYRFAHTPSLNSGRHALEYILMQLPKTPSLIYLPKYTCNVVLEPISKMGINYKFYGINEQLEIVRLPKLKEDEYIIVNNYYGIKDEYINKMFIHYGSKLIVDNAQAFFAKEKLGEKAFYSPRKFVGVPDGGIAWTSVKKELDLDQDFSADRTIHLIRRIDSGASSGYNEFKKNDELLSSMSMKRMSNLTYNILLHLNYDEIIWRRRANFEYLHNVLGSQNRLIIPEMNTFECPMVYPYWTNDNDLRERLIDNNVFVATYWPNVLETCDNGSIEYDLTKNMVSLPIDQRYGEKEMKYILSVI